MPAVRMSTNPRTLARSRKTGARWLSAEYLDSFWIICMNSVHLVVKLSQRPSGEAFIEEVRIPSRCD